MESSDSSSAATTLPGGSEGDESGTTGDAPGASTSSEGAESSGDEPSPPGVDTFPGGIGDACLNEVLPFAPALDMVGPSAQDAYWMMWLARRATGFGEPEVPAELATLGFDDYEEIEVAALGLQAFVISNDNAVFLVFRGSQEVTDWLVNFTFAQVSGLLYGLDGQLHLGFAAALGSAWGDILEAVTLRAEGDKPVWVTGHSLGGAMATLASLRLVNAGLNVAPVYVFGQPRAGDRAFAESAQAQLRGRFYRFVNDRDIVPRVPPAGDAAAAASSVLPLGSGLTEPLITALDYHHVGTMFHLEDGAVIESAPMDDSEDVAYWEALDGEGWLALVSATQIGAWHQHDAYLCHLRQWAFGL